MKKTKKALASIAIAGMVALIPFNALADTAVPPRLGGNTAAQTAVQIAEQTGWSGTAILASSESYGMVDALTAGPLAKFLKAPILLQEAGNVLNPDTKNELVKLNVKTVYVTSGTAVINQAVLNQLASMDIKVVSLGGSDRFETSVNIAKQMVALGADVNKVAAAYGWLNQDALSIASIAAAQTEPILLTEKNSIPASVKAFLSENKGITTTDVIGGTGVVSEAVKGQFPDATRYYGNTAYDTNVAVLKAFDSKLKYDHVFIANGETAIDALAGAPLAAEYNAGIVLTNGTANEGTAYVRSKMTSASIVTALGGSAVVPENVLSSTEYTAPGTTPGTTTPGTTTPVSTIGGGSGGGSYGGGDHYRSPSTSASVSTADQLSTALANSNITSITLTGDITASPTITRPLTMNFGSHTLTGDLTFDYTTSGTSQLTGDAGFRVVGNLTVNTGNADFQNGVQVSGTVNVKDIKIGTWTETADGNNLTISDSNGAIIVITGKPEAITVSQTAAGALTLDVNEGATVGSIITNKPINITVAQGASVAAITANTGSNGSTIINNGTTGTITASAPISITVAHGATLTAFTAEAGSDGLTFTNNGTTGTVIAKVHINLVANVAPGATLSEGTGSISVTGDDQSGVKTIKQLTISDPTLILSKVYDGTTSAAVTAVGYLDGVENNDSVSVNAIATYDTASVGTGKTITVVYTLSGADRNKYAAPIDYVVHNGVITEATTEPNGPTVSSVAVKTPPNKVTYNAGETLDLTGLVVTLTKSDASTEDVGFASFGANGITTDLSQGTVLTTSNSAITITVNGQTTSLAITVNAHSAPTISSISPTTGTTAGGTTVTLTGTGFTGATGVSFGTTTSSAITVVSDTQITAIAPAHSAGSVDVIVTTPNGTTTTSGAFTYVAAPTISSISPTTGTTAGGTTVTITGAGFTGATGVSFGNTTGSAITVVSDTQITATAPAHSAGSVDVIVTTPYGTATTSGAFTYVAGPTISSLSPTSGTTAGGISVTITGTGFTGATGVKFDTSDATTYTVDSNTQITATAPAYPAGSVDVSVTTPYGTTTTSGAFTYVAGPTISSISPTSGTTSGGISVTITGTGFTGATGVSFGNTTGSAITVVSDSQITVTAPAHSAGAVDVSVTTPYGTTTTSGAFTYVDVTPDTIFSSDSATTTGSAISIMTIPSGYTGWFAVSGITTSSALIEGSTMTKANAGATTINAPNTAGSYKFYLWKDSDGSIQEGTKTLTVGP